MSVKFLSIPDKRLSETISASATSFKVSDILGWDDANLASGDFGTVHYAAFRNSAGTKMELMEIDPTTIASASITINKRGLKFDGNLTTEVSGNKKIWVKGDTIVSFGTNPPQIYQYLKEYIDAVVIAGMINASTTQQGAVEIPTQVQIRARTALGETGAPLTVTPDTLPNVLISDYVADTGTADAYVIAPTPAITAYTAGQQFTFKATNANTTASTVNVNSLGVKTIKKLGSSTDLVANDILAGQIVTIEYDGTYFQMLSPVGNAPALSSSFKFGGTGADGALSITSGTTTIDCANAKVVVKNYTSVSITGTGKLAFSNPATNGTIVILKSQGAVTLTSSQAPMIDMSAMGAAGGAAATTGSKGWGFFVSNAAGIGGAATGATTAPSGSLGEVEFSIRSKSLPLFCGAGGGGAGGGGGTGGRGGGGLYIECAGALNFTTSAGISVGGGAPTGAGGGGAGGSCIILYGSLTANTGTITVAGATGGTGDQAGGAGGNGSSGTGAGGAGGSSSNSSGSGGSGGASGYSASNGSGGTTGNGVAGGGGGASGLSLVAANTEFV